MPFELCNASSTFQRLMNFVFDDYIRKFILVYLDDIIIFSKNLADYIYHVRLVFQRLREVTLQIKTRKCDFFKRELTFLRHVIGRDRIKTDSKKIEQMVNLKELTNKRELRSALELFSYYQK